LFQKQSKIFANHHLFSFYLSKETRIMLQDFVMHFFVKEPRRVKISALSYKCFFINKIYVE
jgi:hypothetical protein